MEKNPSNPWRDSVSSGQTFRHANGKVKKVRFTTNGGVHWETPDGFSWRYEKWDRWNSWVKKAKII